MTGPAPGRPAGVETGPSLELTATDAEQTRALAGALAPLCVPGDVLLLIGDLGAGKTTFAQGFGAGLGVVEPVTSPTFTLVRQYGVPPTVHRSGPDLPGPVRTFVHADVYRLDHLHEIIDLGLGELVDDGAVALVEWGDVAEPVLGAGSLAVELVPGSHDSERIVTVQPHGSAWSPRWEALAGALAPWRLGR